MPSHMGTTLTVSVFGQSHSPAIGCVVEGLPSGISIDMDKLQAFMARRAPGQGTFTTPRKEKDIPEIVSGLNQHGTTCGAPLAAIIRNTNTRSVDYKSIASVPRPGHADFPAWVKWGKDHDIAGGGHFSGRLTAPLCLAGGIALQVLQQHGVEVAAHLSSVGQIHDERLYTYNNSPKGREKLNQQIETLHEHPYTLPTLSEVASKHMLAAIDEARRNIDSIGGTIECVVAGLPAGIGSPMFDGMENILARDLFGIPGMKALEFGRGFDVARLHGSEDNDTYALDKQGQVYPTTNNAGGILGGITTGAALSFRLAMKPTSSISRPQPSVNLATMEGTTLTVHGRHDPCIAVRAVPVVEAVAALASLDAWLSFPPQNTALDTQK